MRSTGEGSASHWFKALLTPLAAVAVTLSLAFAAPPMSASETGFEAEAEEGGEGPWAQGAAPPLLELEQFFRDPQHAAGRISPDGDYVALVSAHKGAMNLHLMERGQPLESARPLTAEPRSIMGFFWSRDGRHLIFVRDRDGDENLELRVISLGDAVGEEGIPESRWLAGGDGVQARVQHVPRSTPKYIFVGLNERDPRLHDVYRVSLQTGEKTRVAKNTAEIEGWGFHEGQLRKAVRTTDDAGTEILRVKSQDEFESIYSCAFGETCSIANFHPDGERLYLRTNAGDDRDLIELVLFDPATGEEEPVHRDPEGEVDLGSALFSDRDHRLLATVYTGDRQRIYAHDEDFASHLEWLREALGEGELEVTSRTRDEALWTVGAIRDTDPGSVYLANVEAREIERLYEGRPDLPREYLAPMEPIRYTARDGQEIPGYLTLPHGAELEGLPLVVMPHGGPWIRDTWGYSGTVQFLANRGYAVFQPNFRGSSGFGKAFLNAGNQEWGTGVMQNDVTDGVKYLIDRGIADRNRVAIFGASYGGYAALAGLTWTPELYAAGISMVGPSNLITLMESIPPYWEAGIRRMHGRVGDPEDPDDRERLKAQSPLFHVENIQVPLMVAQGANDPRVKQQESDQMVAALHEAGHPVEYLLAPDEGHGLVDQTNRLAFFAGLEIFLAEHLGGRYQADYSDSVQERLNFLRQDVEAVDSP